jgi:hypothetical protein
MTQERAQATPPLTLDDVARLARAAAEGPAPLGGFSPDMVEVGERGLSLLRDSVLSPPQRWAAHLSDPNRLPDAIYMPPELGGGGVGEPADVYSVAVMTYLAAVGEAPVGALNMPALDRALDRSRARTIVQALSPQPATRPGLDALTRLLEDAVEARAHATAAEDPEAPSTTATDAATTSAADTPGEPFTVDDDIEADQRRRSFLQPMLLVGAFSVFIGALWFIWLSWGSIGDGMRLLLISALTGLVGALSGGLERAECKEAAATFRVLFTQLFWALGGFVLLMLDALDNGYGWMLVGLGVASISAAVGHLKGPRVVLYGLAGLATAIASVTLFVELEGWGEVCFFAGAAVIFRALLALAESGRLKLPVRLLELATLAAVWMTTWFTIVEADSRGLLASFFCVVGWIATRLWAHERRSSLLGFLAHLAGVPTALIIVAISHHHHANIWPSLLLPLMAGLEVFLAESLGRPRHSDLAMTAGAASLWLVGITVADAFGSVDSLELAIIGGLCWATTVGLAFIRQGTATSGAAALHLVVASAFLGEHLSTGTWYGPSLYFFAVELAFVALGLIAFLRHKKLQTSHLCAGAFLALASTVVTLALLVKGDHVLFGALFAYVPSLVMLPLLLANDRDSARAQLGRAAAAAVVAMPGIELFIRSRSLTFALCAATASLLAVGAAVLVRGWDRVADGTREALMWIGIVVAGVVVWFGFLHGAKPHLDDAFGWVLLVAGLTSALFGLGMGAVRAGVAHDGRRLQLLAATGYLVPFFLWSVQGDIGYVALLFLGGAALLALGVAQRHRHVVFGSASTLVLSFWLQFFLRLHDKLPIAVLLIGFGVAVLAFAVLYERRLKYLVQTVKSWPGI